MNFPAHICVIFRCQDGRTLAGCELNSIVCTIDVLDFVHVIESLLCPLVSFDLHFVCLGDFQGYFQRWNLQRIHSESGSFRCVLQNCDSFQPIHAPVERSSRRRASIPREVLPPKPNSTSLFAPELNSPACASVLVSASFSFIPSFILFFYFCRLLLCAFLSPAPGRHRRPTSLRALLPGAPPPPVNDHRIPPRGVETTERGRGGSR